MNSMFWFIQISEINDDFIINEYVQLHIYMHDDNITTRKVFINIKTYVVDELNIELLIDMNVMQKKNIILNCEKDILMLTNHHRFTISFIRTAKQQDVVYCCQFCTVLSISTCQLSVTTFTSYSQTKTTYKLTLSNTSKTHLTNDNLQAQFQFKFYSISPHTQTTSTSQFTLIMSHNFTLSHHIYLIIDNLYTHFSH